VVGLSLEEVAGRRAFASVTTQEQLAGLYVSSDQLAGLRGDDRPESQLMRALASGDAPQHVQVVGPAGAGKSSLILKVLGDLGRREALARPHEVLVVNVGDDPARLESPAVFMRTIVQLVARQGHRFANVDQDALRAASADERTRTGPQVEHRAGIQAPVVGYEAALKEAYETEHFGDHPARAREDFEDVLRWVAREHRPVIVIDDTEHFVGVRDGEVDAASVHNLYHHAIRSLAELDTLDLVVAVHPAYEDVDMVKDVHDRFGFQRVDVPALPDDSDGSALGRILQRRLDRHDLTVQVADVVEATALILLEGVYFLRAHDLRLVLDLAADAATAANRDGVQRIATRHVQPLLDALPS
jgi:Cdc6-like AAA superfamily ATPase